MTNIFEQSSKLSLFGWLHGSKFKIYFGYMLSSWGDKMWWFAGGILIQDLSGSEYGSLMLTGVFTFVLSGSVVAFGAAVGRWVDNTARLKAVKVVLFAQNSLLGLCATTVALTFLFWDTIYLLWDGRALIILQSVIVLTAAMSCIASVGTTIVVEKDWIVVLAEGDLNQLAKFNSAFRAIDLTSQIIAPIVVAVIQDQVSKLASAVTIAVWNIFSMIIEYYLLWQVYKENPSLSVKDLKQHSPNCMAHAEHCTCPERTPKDLSFLKSCYTCSEDWLIYFRHPMRMAGLGLALLFMTVMGLDAVTIAYGNTQITPLLIGAAQGLSALFGITGILSFPRLRRFMGLNAVGLLGLGLQVTALVPCLVSIWLPGSPFDASTLEVPWHPSAQNESSTISSPSEQETNNNNIGSAAALFGGIIASRYGLWLYDLTATQIMQEQTVEHKRGVINGVQGSLNMCMDMLKSLLVILFPYPQQFGLLIILSFSSVLLGSFSYVMYFCSSNSNTGTENSSKEPTQEEIVQVPSSTVPNNWL